MEAMGKKQRAVEVERKIAFSILVCGLLIGVAATASWYWCKHKDTDNDGITDYLEIHQYHTDPNKLHPVLAHLSKEKKSDEYALFKPLDSDDVMEARKN